MESTELHPIPVVAISLPGSSRSVSGKGELQPLTETSHHIAHLGARLMDLMGCPGRVDFLSPSVLVFVLGSGTYLRLCLFFQFILKNEQSVKSGGL